MATSISGAGLSVSLPDPRDWDVRKDRPQENASTLAGGAVISSWAKSLEGARIEYSQAVTEAVYQSLVALDQHATQTTWTVEGPDGCIYLATIDIKSAARIYRYSLPYRELRMEITVVRRTFP